MSMRQLIVSATLLALCLAIPRSHAQPKPESYWIVILGGGKTKDAASKVVKQFKNKVFYMKTTGAHALIAWPQERQSKEFSGLNPGFHIAVLGLCKTIEKKKADMEALIKVVRALQPGAYYKKVHGAFGNPCPDSAPFMNPAGKENDLRLAISRKPESVQALFAYARFLEQEIRFEEASAFLDAILAKDPDNADAKGLAQKIMVLTTD